MDLKKLILTLSFLSFTLSQTYLNECTKSEIAPEDEDDCIRSDITDETIDCCYAGYTNKEGSIIKRCIKVTKSQISSELIAQSSILDIKDNTTPNITCPKFGYINNNCGIVGHGEPFKKEHCSTVTIPEKYCCFLTYKLAGDTDNHHVCRLVDDYIDEGKTTKESTKLIEKLYDGAVLESGICFSKIIEYSFSMLILTLGLLLL